MEITLIRHTSVNVPSGTVYGFTDVEVAETFPEEAEKVAQALATEKFDLVYSSPLSRCRKLAAYCGYTSPRLDDRLKELNFGSWEMKRWDEIEDPLLGKWYKDWIHLPAGNGESFTEQYLRVAAFLDELRQKEYKKVCLFVHSGVLRCALIYAGHIRLEEAFTHDIPYGGRIDILL